MSADDATRTAVRTYVPAYQRDKWTEEAEELDMSRSEFVRTMVQAGRRSFDLDESAGPDGDGVSSDPTDRDRDEASGEPIDAQVGSDLADRVLDILHDRPEPQTWDDLVAAVTDDVEARLDEALEALQSAGELRYSGREGGYVPTDD